MSKVIVFDEWEQEFKEIYEDLNECKHKVNGICYNNSKIKKLGKKCYSECEWSEK